MSRRRQTDPGRDIARSRRIWSCSGPPEAIAFYEKAFGATEFYRMPGPDGRLMHAELHDRRFPGLPDGRSPRMGGPVARDAIGGSPVTIHLYVEDVDAAFAGAVEAGATVEDAADGHVLGRPLRQGRRPVRPRLVDRPACSKTSPPRRWPSAARGLHGRHRRRRSEALADVEDDGRRSARTVAEAAVLAGFVARPPIGIRPSWRRSRSSGRGAACRPARPGAGARGAWWR